MKLYLMYKVLISILLLSFIGCKITDENNTLKQKIIGEWFLVAEETIPISNSNLPLPPPYQVKDGYIFKENNEVEVQLGFFRRNQKLVENEWINQFIGSTTDYKIGKDSTLKIFSLSDSAWYNQKILSLTSDTMELRWQKGEYFYIDKFAKYLQKLDILIQFDKIYLASTGCYGSCPILEIIIQSNGDVLFHGKRFTTKKGFFTSKISNEKYKKLADNFRKVNLSTLPNDFAVSYTDANSVIVNFWQGDKLVKVVRDYGRDSPSAFVCAYSQLTVLYQHIDLSPINENIGKKIFEKYPPQ